MPSETCQLTGPAVAGVRRAPGVLTGVQQRHRRPCHRVTCPGRSQHTVCVFGPGGPKSMLPLIYTRFSLLGGTLC